MLNVTQRLDDGCLIDTILNLDAVSIIWIQDASAIGVRVIEFLVDKTTQIKYINVTDTMESLKERLFGIEE
jgi:hypothetical protein